MTRPLGDWAYPCAAIAMLLCAAHIALFELRPKPKPVIRWGGIHGEPGKIDYFLGPWVEKK